MLIMYRALIAGFTTQRAVRGPSHTHDLHMLSYTRFTSVRVRAAAEVDLC